MSVRRNQELAEQIKGHIKKGLTNPQIAAIVGRSRFVVANIVKREIGANPNYRTITEKHRNRNLYKLCLEHFQDHTFEETQLKFELTKSELKSVFTYAYRMPHLAHLRKDERRRDAWALKETLTMIRMAGLVERKTIGKVLNRSKNYQGIKDRLNLMNLKSRSVNGLTLSKYRELFDRDPRVSIRTNAGSGGSNGLKVILVPWVSIDGRSLKGRPEFILKLIKSMTMFQLWIWEERSKAKCLSKIKKQLKLK